MDLQDAKYFVHEKTYTIVKSRVPLTNCFAMINDGDEITLIVEQWSTHSDLLSKDILDMDRDWRVITFDMLLDFSIVGFLSRIASALAEHGIAIFVISGYSTDHLFVKEKDLEETMVVLQKLGFQLISK